MMQKLIFFLLFTVYVTFLLATIKSLYPNLLWFYRTQGWFIKKIGDLHNYVRCDIKYQLTFLHLAWKTFLNRNLAKGPPTYGSFHLLFRGVFKPT